MVDSKKIINGLFFLFLVIFPFGQIIRFGFFHPLDLAVGLIFLVSLILRLPKPEIFKLWQNFLLAAAFSFLLDPQPLGWLYLLRLVAYFYLLVFSARLNKKLAVDSLLLSGVFVAVFGWVQYFLYPDLRFLIFKGWDDHFYRLVSTFLDPAFTGLILVLALIIALEKKKVWLSLGLLISLAFTYSRASYLAFLLVLGFSGFLTKKFNKFLLFAFLSLLLLLPRPGGLGVDLGRTVTIAARWENYHQGLQLFAKAPLFGVGYNNLCPAKKIYLGQDQTSSHACSGLDSSLLVVLVTTGAVGFLVFLNALIKSFQRIRLKTTRGRILAISLAAVLVHSLFSNSFFYPWVLAWLAILGGVADS